MEIPDEQHAIGKVDIALKEAHQYNYFQLIELLQQLHGDDLEQRPPSRDIKYASALRPWGCCAAPFATHLRLAIAEALSVHSLNTLLRRLCQQTPLIGRIWQRALQGASSLSFQPARGAQRGET